MVASPKTSATVGVSTISGYLGHSARCGRSTFSQNAGQQRPATQWRLFAASGRMPRCFSRVGWSLVSGKHKELASRVASKLSPVSSLGKTWLGRARLGRDLEEELVEEAVRRYLASQVMSRTGVVKLERCYFLRARVVHLRVRCSLLSSLRSMVFRSSPQARGLLDEVGELARANALGFTGSCV